jgi:hypothetical protein
MNNFFEILINVVSTIFDRTSMISSLFSEGICLTVAGSGVIIAFALGVIAPGVISDGLLANVRRWHGNIDEQYTNINILINAITAHQPAWTIPADLLTLLTNNRDQLRELIDKCKSPHASQADRTLRNSLLKSTVGICLLQIKIWAYGEYAAGVMTADDVHLLGFLLPGEQGGHHSRKEPTDVIAEVKVAVLNSDFIRVVVDQSAGENAAQVVHGWPFGVRQALIVILADDGVTEVLRLITTRLHNDIRMPDGSRGKLFIIKAAFLKHIDDEPKFGNEPTFSMPISTEDLAATIDQQHHANFEEQLKEIERQRQIIEQLQRDRNIK